MNQIQLFNIRREIREGTYPLTMEMPAVADAVTAGVLRDIMAMGDRPGDVEFDPPIEESGP